MQINKDGSSKQSYQVEVSIAQTSESVEGLLSQINQICQKFQMIAPEMTSSFVIQSLEPIFLNHQHLPDEIIKAKMMQFIATEKVFGEDIAEIAVEPLEYTEPSVFLAILAQILGLGATSLSVLFTAISAGEPVPKETFQQFIGILDKVLKEVKDPISR